MQLLTIHEASQIAGKSIQTIRRMIKQKKVQVKRQKTPQGFNYLIIQESLKSYMDKAAQMDIRSTLDTQNIIREHRPVSQPNDDIFRSEMERLTTTIQRLIDQNEKDKENFFNLIKTFQDRNAVLEDKVKLLEAPKPSWWKLWK